MIVHDLYFAGIVALELKAQPPLIGDLHAPSVLETNGNASGMCLNGDVRRPPTEML